MTIISEIVSEKDIGVELFVWRFALLPAAMLVTVHPSTACCVSRRCLASHPNTKLSLRFILLHGRLILQTHRQARGGAASRRAVEGLHYRVCVLPPRALLL